MAITTVDQLVEALATRRQKVPISKGPSGTPAAGQTFSYWRFAGYPPIGVAPAAPKTCNNTTLGCIPFDNPTGGRSTYIARLMLSSTIVGGVEIHDRLVDMGGLSGIVTTAQTVGTDLFALATTDNIAARMVSADYSRVQWWLEVTTQLGATAATATFTYTDAAGVSGKTAAVAVPATARPGLMLQIIPTNGDFIRSVDSVTLSVSTGTAGAFGVVATVQRTEISMPLASVGVLLDWAGTGLAVVADSSCLFLVANIATSVSTGPVYNGAITLVQG